MKKRMICGLLAMLLATALAFPLAVWVTRRTSLTILMYHNIVADDAPINGMTVTVSRFEQDMQWLCDHGYTSVLPRELAAGEPLPDRAVLITFDDGYVSNYTYAFPILQRLHLKAAVSLVGRVVDAYDFSFLDWDMCREMSASGLVEFGSHTYDLHNLDGRGGNYTAGTANGIRRLDGECREDYEARVLPDLQKSIDVISGALGAPVTYFSYPFGVTEPWADAFLEAHFALTVTTREGAASPSRGLYGLPRKVVTMDRTAAECCSFLIHVIRRLGL